MGANIYGKYGTLFNSLTKIIPNLEELAQNEPGTGFKLRTPERFDGKGKNKVPVFRDGDPWGDTYLPLSVTILSKDDTGVRLSLTHFYRDRDGDLLNDLDVELRVDFKMGIVDPEAVQNGSGRQRRVYTDDRKSFRPAIRADLLSFLPTWFRNLRQQGHVLDTSSLPQKKAA